MEVIDLLSYTEAAHHFGVRRETIADLVPVLGLMPKTINKNKKCKGLDYRDIEALASVLRPTKKAS